MGNDCYRMWEPSQICTKFVNDCWLKHTICRYE